MHVTWIDPHLLSLETLPFVFVACLARAMTATTSGGAKRKRKGIETLGQSSQGCVLIGKEVE
jgi:hypothetical protein